MPSPTVQLQVDELHLQPLLFIVLPVVLIVTTGITIGMRFYARLFILKKFAVDDWLLLAAWVPYLATSATIVAIGALEYTKGVLRPLADLTMLVYAGICLYLFAQILCKIAMAGFFLRITLERWQKYIIHTSAFVYTAYVLALAFVVLFDCGKPSAAHFDSLASNCLPWTVFMPLIYVSGVLNAGIDIIFVVTSSLVIFKNTHMPRKSKMSVIAILMLGILGSVISIARIPLLDGYKHQAGLIYFHRITQISMLSLIEIALSLMAISLAACRPLLQKWMRSSAVEETEEGEQQEDDTKALKSDLSLENLDKTDVRDSFVSKVRQSLDRTWQAEAAKDPSTSSAEQQV